MSVEGFGAEASVDRAQSMGAAVELQLHAHTYTSEYIERPFSIRASTKIKIAQIGRTAGQYSFVDLKYLSCLCIPS